MHDLRLTHGGFYGHFDSKEELFTEAFRESLEELSQKMLSALEHATKGGELKALINRYLSIDHCEDVAGGCPVRLCNQESARTVLEEYGVVSACLCVCGLCTSAAGAGISLGTFGDCASRVASSGR